jgi:hypothetical protein
MSYLGACDFFKHANIHKYAEYLYCKNTFKKKACIFLFHSYTAL